MHTLIATNIKNLRKEKNISRKLLAELLDVKSTTISQWERGISIPDEEQIQQIVQVLNVEESDITGVHPEKEIQTPRNQSDKVRIHNGWEFLAEYWWTIMLLIGAIGWAGSMILDSWPK